MPRIDDTITFLHDKGVLGTAPSPWPSLDESEDAIPIDFQDLFGPRRRKSDPSTRRFDEDFPDDPIFDEDVLDPWEELSGHIEGSELEGFWASIGTGYSPSEAGTEGIDQSPGPRPPTQMDIAAWYQPIHFFGPEWGIYIKEDAIMRQKNLIARFLPPQYQSLPFHRIQKLYRACYRASFAIYLLHEQYHHKTECLGVRLHVIEGKSVYLPYFNKVYLPLKGTDDHLEEALANAYIFQRIKSTPYKAWLGKAVLKATLEFLRVTLPFHPPGYCQALRYEKKPAFDQGENLLQTQIHEGVQKPVQTSSEWDLAPNLIESFFPWKTTLYMVIPAGSPRARLWPHLQPAPSCSTKDLLRLCESRGWSLVKGGKGSHIKLKKEGAGRPIIIPGNRKRLAVGTLKSVITALGEKSVHSIHELVAST